MILTLKKLVIIRSLLAIGPMLAGCGGGNSNCNNARQKHDDSKYIPSKASYAQKDEMYINNYVRRSKSLPIDTISKYIEDQKNSVYVML